MTAPLRLVIFDVDGTLVDSQAQIIAAMIGAFSARDLRAPSRSAILSIVGLSLDHAMARLAPDESAAARSALVEAYRESFFRNRLSAGPDGTPPLYPGSRQALDALQAHDDVLLGIATGKSRRGLDALIDAHDLAGMFVTRQVADNHPSKPNPSMIHAAMHEAGVTAGDTVMIGDTSFDMQMARSAQVAAIGVGWGYHPVAQLDPHSDAIVDDFGALNNALRKLWEGER